MERGNFGPEEAFDQLRRASQTANRKLRDIAADVVGGIAQKGKREDNP